VHSAQERAARRFRRNSDVIRLSLHLIMEPDSERYKQTSLLTAMKSSWAVRTMEAGKPPKRHSYTVDHPRTIH
jgi:hypothetical protein